MILLDTAVWIWWVVDPSRLSAPAQAAIESEEARHGLIVSAISVWEESTLLPGRLHRDPADRILVAIARRLEMTLVTSDRTLRRYRHVRTLW